MEEIIYKSQSEITEIEKGIIVGYANVYNVKDWDGDISMPGSFNKTVAERSKKIKVFKNHTKMLVGVPVEMDTADPYGLRTVTKMLMDTEAGRDTHAEMKFLFENGMDAGLSIGGGIVKRNQKNKSQVLEYMLTEYSMLTTEDPANDFSLVAAVKSVKNLPEPSQAAFWQVIEKAYNEKFSDGMLKSLEHFLTLNAKPEQVAPATTLDREPSADLIVNIYEQFNF